MITVKIKEGKEHCNNFVSSMYYCNQTKTDKIAFNFKFKEGEILEDIVQESKVLKLFFNKFINNKYHYIKIEYATSLNMPKLKLVSWKDNQLILEKIN